MAVITSLGVMYATLPRTRGIQLSVVRYTDIAGKMGVTADGCLAGHIVDWLPMEVRHYRTRQLVGDEIQVKLGDLVLKGSGGVFEFPVSSELMSTNPRVRVVDHQGVGIDYRYQLRKVSRPPRGECGEPEPGDPPA